ncbi:MAG: PIN domain-containing protein [Microcystis aeruginosa LG13-12]|nr:PIN domain-containing protein [Microcystis aeruginosa LG13-12]
MFGCGVKSKRIGFFHVSHFSIYFVNVLIFNSKANLERRGFRPKIFDETINVLKRKFSLSYSQIREAVQELSEGFPIVLVSVNTIEMALNLAERYQYSYFDSLILASALEAGCQILYSEDLHDGQRIENQLMIINPFS